jgi:hypothetical protein
MSAEEIDDITVATKKSNEASERMIINTAKVRQGIEDVRVSG